MYSHISCLGGLVTLNTKLIYEKQGFTMHVYQIHLELVVMDKEYFEVYFGES